MKSSRIKTALTIVLMVIICFMLGCIFGPEKDQKTDPVPPPEFMDLTEKEHVVFNLVLTYKKLDIEHYAELLHEDYIWYNQEGSDPEFLTRDQDIAATKGIFDSKKFGHPDENKRILSLELDIGEGTWSAIDTLEGQPCSDCWYTRRVYDITLEMASGTHIHAHDYVDLYIVGVEEDGKKKYQIIRADDVKIPTGGIQ